MLSLFSLVQSLPCIFGFLACQASPTNSVPAHPDSFSHFPSLLPSYPVFTPYPMPILIKAGVLSVLCLFLDFSSAKAMKAAMFIACKMDA